MGYKILKNKTFHIPTERIKEAEKQIKEQEELTRRVKAMTDAEYEVYVRKALAEIDTHTEEDYISEEEFWKELNEDMELWHAEIKNHERWKKVLKGFKLQNTVSKSFSGDVSDI